VKDGVVTPLVNLLSFKTPQYLGIYSISMINYYNFKFIISQKRNKGGDIITPKRVLIEAINNLIKKEGGIMKRMTLVTMVILMLAFSVNYLSAQELGFVEALGKSIFFDEDLSINENQSCASCHAPEVGWTGPIEAINASGAVYEGSILGRFGDRKPPSAAYATLSPIFHSDKKGLFIGGNFWDGRATGEKLGNPAADQARAHF
jgi:hypothetical protein